MFSKSFSTTFNHLKDFYNCLLILLFDECVETLNVYVACSESVFRHHSERKNSGPSRKHKRIGSEYYCVLRIENQKVGAGGHGCVQATSGERFELDSCKVGKVIQNMLAGVPTPHVVSLATVGIHLKLLFIGYGVSHVSLLYTKSYILPNYYTKESFGKVEQILTDMWRLQVGISFIHYFYSQS